MIVERSRKIRGMVDANNAEIARLRIQFESTDDVEERLGIFNELRPLLKRNAKLCKKLNFYRDLIGLHIKVLRKLGS